jgi:hypothetical protein
MPGGMTRREAMAYFGLEEEAELERVAVEYELDVDVDTEGRIIEVDADDARRALFGEHERKVGHRPDDPAAHAKAQKAHRDRQAAAKRRRRERRVRLQERVRRRASLTEG